MKIFYLFITLILLFSCTQLTPEEKMIKESLGKTVEIGMFESILQGDREIPFGEFRERYPFISQVYLEDGCLPCYPRFMDNLSIYVPDYEPVNERFHMVIDADYRFLDNNPDIDRWIIDKSLLIDAGDKIKLIGPPFASQRMADLFYTICMQ